MRAPLILAGLALGVSACAVAGPGSAKPQPLSEARRGTPHEPAASVAQRPPLAAPVVSSVHELSALQLDAVVEPYQNRDSAWVPGQPILVNRDFDFGMAMQGGDIGPGIAAAQRRQANLAIAKQLGSLAPIDVAASLRALCNQPHALCTKFGGARVRVYGLLFGDREARLRVIFEPTDGDAGTVSYSAVTDPRPVSAFAESQTLAAMFDKGLAAIADLLDAGDAAASATSGQCGIGDRAQMRGQIITSDDRHIVMLVAEPRATRLSCPKDAFNLEPPPAPEAH